MDISETFHKRTFFPFFLKIRIFGKMFHKEIFLSYSSFKIGVRIAGQFLPKYIENYSISVSNKFNKSESKTFYLHDIN